VDVRGQILRRVEQPQKSLAAHAGGWFTRLICMRERLCSADGVGDGGRVSLDEFATNTADFIRISLPGKPRRQIIASIVGSSGERLFIGFTLPGIETC
jgi:hypothetical protein